MKFRFILPVFASVILFFSSIPASSSPPDEGMWLLSLVDKYNYATMRHLGCKLKPEEIYSEVEPSLKDAIVSFDGICTGEFVSAEGLLFTNHHCGYDAIASLSTVENNILENGYWATDRTKEIPVEGLYVKLMVHMQDVSDSIIPLLAGLAADERIKKVQELSKAISVRASEQGKFKTEVKPFFYGNQYFLFVYKVFNDIRLAGTAPESIGRFGGETDNWMWPRHTGDFAIFRVYADKDNNPTAGYAPDHVPYRPGHFLPVSLKGVQEGDFQMMLGYPGSTNRYLPSFAIQNVIEHKNPALIRLMEAMASVMKEDMSANPELKIALAADYASLTNSLKLYESQLPGLERMQLVERKQAEEAAFLKWTESKTSDSSAVYRKALLDLKQDYEQVVRVEVPYFFAFFNVNYSPVGNFALEVHNLENVLAKDTPPEKKDQVVAEVKTSASEYFRSFAPETQKKILISMLNLYYAEKPGGVLPQPIADMLSKYKGATVSDQFKAFADAAYSQSILTSEKRFDDFISKPSIKALQRDEFYKYYIAMSKVATDYRTEYQAANRNVTRDMRTYVKGLMEREANLNFYPDANGTLRLCYGTVQDYSPRDAVFYDWKTTLSGIIEKADSTFKDYRVPRQLINLYHEKDFGRYSVKGDVPVCFITTNDITGGSSGSPVINAYGELTGLVFDGNFEGTAGDYEIDPDLNRSLCVDIRYVLFIIEKIGGAKNLIDELTIVH